MQGIEPGTQWRFGPAICTHLDLNIGSGSCVNLVCNVRVPDRDQSRSKGTPSSHTALEGIDLFELGEHQYILHCVLYR